MNMNTAKALLVLGGALFGSGVTWLSIRKHYADLAQAEIDDVKEYYEQVSRYNQELIVEVETETVTVEEEAKFVPPIPTGDVTSIVASTKGDVRDYTKPGGPVLPPREPDMTPRPVLAPVIITEAQFYNEHDEFDKAFWKYYTVDDTLSDERDMVAKGTVLGQAALDNLRQEGKSYVCVRVNSQSCDYYIEVVPGSYSELVDGHEPDED